MTIATTTNSLAQVLDQVLPGQLANALNQLKFGRLVRQAMPVTMRRCNPNAAATNPYIPGTASQCVAETLIGTGGTGQPAAAAVGSNLLGQLPDDAKAEYILRATAIAGTSTPQELTCDSMVTSFGYMGTAGTGPTTLHIGISPSGDIVTNATDAWTSVDVSYIPQKVDAVEYPALSCVAGTGICALPVAATTQGVVTLMEAESLAGTTVGKFAVLTPSNSNPGATKQANLNAAKTQVLFKVSDAVTSARVKVGLVSAVNSNQLLEAASTFF